MQAQIPLLVYSVFFILSAPKNFILGKFPDSSSYIGFAKALAQLQVPNLQSRTPGLPL